MTGYAVADSGHKMYKTQAART